MLRIDTKYPRRGLMIGLIATLAAICLLLITTLGTLADTVHISDKAGVLNTSQMQSEAAKLPYPVNIYTMNNFTGSESAFNQEAVRTLNDANNPRLIIIAIDTRNKFLAIVGGKDVSSSNSVYNDAVNAFKSNYNGGDYRGATIAALRSLQSSLGGSTGSGVSNTGAGFSILPLCLIGLLVVLGLTIIWVFFSGDSGVGDGGYDDLHLRRIQQMNADQNQNARIQQQYRDSVHGRPPRIY